MKLPAIVRELGQRLRVAGSVMMDGRAHAGPIRTSADLAAFLAGGRRTLSGVMVTPETAMKISAVNACVRVLAEGVAMLPLNVYRHLPKGGKEREAGSKLDRILHTAPNRWQTSFEYREMMMGHVLLRGNAFALKIMVNGELDQKIPLNPDRMKYGRAGDQMVYEYTKPSGEQVPFSQKEIFHLRGLSSDGVGGRSVISDMSEGMGIATQHETFEATSYARGGMKNVVLSHPQLLNEGAANRIRNSYAEKYGGEDGMWRPILLEEGLKIDELSLTASDMQFLETRRFRIADLARPFRVPLHLIGELDRSTNNNIETQSLEFLIYTLMPWLIRWEQRIQMDLIGPDDAVHFAKHNVNGLLRGDIAKRGTYYGAALLNGWMNKDEVRALEDMNPIPGGAGQRFMEPVNVQEAGSQPPNQPAPTGGPL